MKNLIIAFLMLSTTTIYAQYKVILPTNEGCENCTSVDFEVPEKWSYCDVYVNGAMQTPNNHQGTFFSLSLPIGSHVVTIENKQGKTRSRSVKIGNSFNNETVKF